MPERNIRDYLNLIQRRSPSAYAMIKGDMDHPQINGGVYFFRAGNGSFLIADVTGLPHTPGNCYSGVFGFHIHEGDSCTGNETDPFADTGGHYNPRGCEHPHHAGDLPPLFENDGHAFMAFFTNRFTVSEVVGRTVVIHSSPDDFTTQPSGNSGKRIACGVIQRM